MAEKLGIISSFEPLKKGEQFDEFPLHLTLMTWFSMPHRATFIHQLQNFATRYEPQVIVGGEEDLFGTEKDIRVRKLGKAGSLYAMHGELLEMVTRLGGEVWSGGYVGKNYVPHVTYQGDSGLDEGEEARIDRLQVIASDELGPKTVIANLGLLKGRK